LAWGGVAVLESQLARSARISRRAAAKIVEALAPASRGSLL
jgi:hypothetical protein